MLVSICYYTLSRAAHKGFISLSENKLTTILVIEANTPLCYKILLFRNCKNKIKWKSQYFSLFIQQVDVGKLYLVVSPASFVSISVPLRPTTIYNIKFKKHITLKTCISTHEYRLIRTYRYSVLCENDNSYKKLIDAHASVDSNFAAKIALEFLLLHGFRSIIRQQLH